MLSAKAKAFSIDSLLAPGPNRSQETIAVDTERHRYDLGICHQDNPTKKHAIRKCFHQSIQSVTGMINYFICKFYFIANFVPFSFSTIYKCFIFLYFIIFKKNNKRERPCIFNLVFRNFLMNVAIT